MQTTVKFESEAEYRTVYPLLSDFPITTRCISAPEFLETLLEIANDDHHIFRGQGRSFWPIIATLFRPDFIAKPAIDYWFTHEKDEGGRDEYYGEYLDWEQEIAYEFAESCMKQGIPLPHIPYNEMLKLDTETVSAYFVARNYGIPNRLLDFTTSAIVAAWFASDIEVAQDSSEKGNEIVVWAIKQEFVTRIGYAMVSTSWANAQIPQMQRQKAVLLVDNKGKENYLATGKFQPMEYMIEALARKHRGWNSFDLPIQRVTLPQDEALNLQGTLSNFDLNHIHLFPTMDNVAQRTLRKFKRYGTVKNIT